MINIAAKPPVRWNAFRKIFIKKDVLSSASCREIIDYGKLNANKGVSKYPDLFNVSFKTCLLPLDHSIHSILAPLWEDVINFYGFDISQVEHYELKQYSTGDFFEKHTDNYYGIQANMDRKITLSVQLSDIDEYDGGELNVLQMQHKLPLGSVICFPSFFPHSVKKITSGERWSLINWAWGPYWR